MNRSSILRLLILLYYEEVLPIGTPMSVYVCFKREAGQNGGWCNSTLKLCNTGIAENISVNVNFSRPLTMCSDLCQEEYKSNNFINITTIESGKCSETLCNMTDFIIPIDSVNSGSGSGSGKDDGLILITHICTNNSATNPSSTVSNANSSGPNTSSPGPNASSTVSNESSTGPNVSSTGPNTSSTGPNVSSTGPNASSTGPTASSTVSNESSTGPNTSSPGPNVSSSSTGPNASSTGPNTSSTGPNASSTGPNTSSTGPNASSTGPNTSSTGPTASSTGPNTSSTGSNASSTGPNASSTVPNVSSTGPNVSSTGPNTSSTVPNASSTASVADSTTAASLDNESTQAQFSTDSDDPVPAAIAVSVVVSVIIVVLVVAFLMYRKGQCKQLLGKCANDHRKHSPDRSDELVMGSMANANLTYDLSSVVDLNNYNEDYSEIDMVDKEQFFEYSQVNLKRKQPVHSLTYNHIGHFEDTEHTYNHFGDETSPIFGSSTLQPDTYSHVGAMARPASGHLAEDSYAHINGVMKDLPAAYETNQYDCVVFHSNGGQTGNSGHRGNEIQSGKENKFIVVGPSKMDINSDASVSHSYFVLEKHKKEA